MSKERKYNTPEYWQSCREWYSKAYPECSEIDRLDSIEKYLYIGGFASLIILKLWGVL